ncbi:MAG: hypothetical protein R3342_07595 [Lutibacter sp.]|nr:hypothetical protein [Lutibacter sp.]MDX1829394.1 hypothetical protein [Lutibacter sp.]
MMMVESEMKNTKTDKKLRINTLVEGFSFKNKKGEKVTPKKIVRL